MARAGLHIPRETREVPHALLSGRVKPSEIGEDLPNGWALNIWGEFHKHSLNCVLPSAVNERWSYESHMLLESHGRGDEGGLNFTSACFLVYFFGDDFEFVDNALTCLNAFTHCIRFLLYLTPCLSGYWNHLNSKLDPPVLWDHAGQRYEQ